MLEEGDQVRDYTLRRFLGQGSYGEVWLAERRIEVADECIPFALKFLAGQADNSSKAESLKNEVRTWIKAGNHFNIVPVYDGFVHSRFLVIVSEYVDGGTLRDWLAANNGKAPSFGKAVEMISGILRGLNHLHSRKIIHRDLKPENILLKDGVPKITDFGVSRMVETFSQSAVLRHTRGAGAPLYMPPEAFKDGRPIPQLDTWSAGVMFFEMLSGDLPFQADTLPALVGEIANSEPRPLPPNLRELQQFVLRSLSKNPSGRFQTAEQMGQALETAWAQTEQHRQWNRETVSDEVPKEKGTGSHDVAEARPHLEVANSNQSSEVQADAENRGLPRVEAERKVKDPNKLRKLLWVGIGLLVIAIIGGVVWWKAKNPGFQTFLARGKECLERKDYDCALQNYARAVEQNPQSADAFYGRGRAHNNKGDFDRGIADLTKAIELNPNYALAYTYRGGAYAVKGNLDEAVNNFNRAIELDPQYYDSYFNRGIAYRDKGDDEQAIRDLSRAAELNPLDPKIPFERGLVYREVDRSQAIRDLTKAIELDPKYVSAYAERGAAFLFEGNFDQAIKDLDIAIDLNPKLATAFYYRGLAYGNKGNSDQAMRDFTSAIELNPNMAEAYAYRGSSYSNKRQFNQAMLDFEKAIQLNPRLAEAYYNRGLAHGAMNNPEEAAKDFTKAIELNSKDARYFYGRGVAYQTLRQPAKARADFAKYQELSAK